MDCLRECLYQIAETDLREYLKNIQRLLFCNESHDAQKVAADLAWDRVMAPLVAFCQSPRAAADKRARLNSGRPGSGKTWSYLLSQAWGAFRKGGPPELYRSIEAYRRWTRSGRQ